MAAGAALPGLFFCFAAMVLLIFVSVSAPTWNAVRFLSVYAPGHTTRFGCFGYTGTDHHIGYYFDQAIIGATVPSRLNDHILHNLTETLILHPIAAGLAGIAFLFGLCGAGYHRAGTVFMSLIAALAMLTTLVAWVLDMVLFGIARDRFRDAGVNAQFGNALWLTLGALVSLFIGFVLAACGVFGHYRRRRTAY
ncbi:pali-domain-containing protein [Gloeophyllum trabeum ATCC 11539]|uniref:Pali-domain-containing protein n=1 Tax=Gloeophyllum trabeum (strain ATCC 11539 / FP-39264 / Madison 617) TaxID=670483 RepID=S7QDN8_GLOTA|nr:pali-domain-containing protein [Gloeophyllum trabeum ATCC 11539]EPQ57447.1 pali-domain-containing protein [Gloeophyllum trabeum ATCC 11539]